MSFMRVMLSGAATAALLVSTATPAFAGHRGGWYGGGGYGWSSGWGGGRGWGRRHDHIDAGDVIAGVLVIGTIAAVASAASKSSRSRSRYPDDRSYPRDRDYPRSDSRDDNGRTADSRISTEDDAAYACADAAEARTGNGARVRDITDVRKTNDGWDVEGTVERRDSWRDRSGDAQRFSCSVRFGAVENVSVDGKTVAIAE